MHRPDAHAILLPYMLRHTHGDNNTIASLWEHAFMRAMNAYAPVAGDARAPAASLSWWTSETLANESAHDRDKLMQAMVVHVPHKGAHTWCRYRCWLCC
jgi:hypothetical protein